jgi:hypothetical protein
VAENVYTRLLKQLVAIEGSRQAVASLLRVPEGTLVWWMNGRAQMPLRALLKAMDLVAKHELRDQPDRFTFDVGSARARCAGCGATEFRRRDPAAPLTYRSLLACAICGHEVVHADLVVQVAKEAGQQARKVRAPSQT